jgi:hypothetical protein
VAAVTDDAVKVIQEVVADKGYHSRTIVHDLKTLEIRTYISEPDRGPQSWIDQRAERDAVYPLRGSRSTPRRPRDTAQRFQQFQSLAANLHGFDRAFNSIHF